MFTLRDGSLNIHFDVDNTGLRGLTWGISATPPEGSNVFPVVLTAERFGRDYLAVAAQVSGDVRPRVWLVNSELWATYSQHRRSAPILQQACLIGSEPENVQALGSL